MHAQLEDLPAKVMRGLPCAVPLRVPISGSDKGLVSSAASTVASQYRVWRDLAELRSHWPCVQISR